ncbi:hypothetical protein TMEN_853 [Trichophyton mentagrophytes]|uniref:Acid phosphatase pho5 n=3 Tax=Trichophyton TaxID=5550 RepID=A0A9P5CZS8_9EURO|nr:hypothetical protein TESG_01818 [Trichophyton tonsurans CBS 112818]EGE05139.1 hypothetical protein TEQG_04156 [Trichophyton equinum CBS 127.97]EZF29876.1 hypothetical protein H101_06474 [Trichophyton interdigitale H6]KAF3895386.1 Acid phosphatase pho5 [Trichophyton interdigitale]GBF59593.1 hypothetical protein TMEN_853 [Trichophyton mentagrophytes]
MRWFGWLILIIILALLAYGGWIGYSQIRARRAGLPPPPLKSYLPFTSSPASYGDANYPTPRSGGIVGWFKDKVAALRNRRTHQGSYEDHLEPRAYRGGAGRPLSEQDEPWDTRMGAAERDGGFGPPGYYEEQELGFAPHTGGYDRNAAAYDGGLAPGAGQEAGRGRSLSRDPSPVKLGQGDDPSNPFGDHAEGSNLRSVSPRPEPPAGEGSAHAQKGVFRESL